MDQIFIAALLNNSGFIMYKMMTRLYMKQGSKVERTNHVLRKHRHKMLAV